MVKWLASTAHKKDRSSDLAKLRWIDPYLHDKPLQQITSEVIIAIQQARSEDRSIATVNRYIGVISAVLHYVHKLDWIPAVPAIPRYKETNKPTNWITPEQADALIYAMESQPRSKHIADMARFALATGLRAANVKGLQWRHLHGNAAIFQPHEHKAGYKTGKILRSPLNRTALEVVERWKGLHETHVFCYRGKPLKSIGVDGFHSAKRSAGLPDLRWHDLRHTWASWHVMNGTPLQVLQELGGWESYEMVLRYAHLAPSHVDSYADNVVNSLRNVKTL